MAPRKRNIRMLKISDIGKSKDKECQAEESLPPHQTFREESTESSGGQRKTFHGASSSNLGGDGDGDVMEMIRGLAQTVQAQVKHRPDARKKAEKEKIAHLKLFQGMAPAFTGKETPEKAGSWVKAIEKIFESISAEDDSKVRMATFVLTENADHWWSSAKRTFFKDRKVEEISWEEFLKVFDGKYFPSHIRKEKMREFLGLRQGNMTVQEYDNKFVELERFTTKMEDDGERMEKFIYGLRAGLREKVMGARTTSFADAVEQAYIFEKN